MYTSKLSIFLNMLRISNSWTIEWRDLQKKVIVINFFLLVELSNKIDKPEISPESNGFRPSSWFRILRRDHSKNLYIPDNHPKNKQKLNVSFENRPIKFGIIFLAGLISPNKTAMAALNINPK
jgi:hypothetical protein